MREIEIEREYENGTGRKREGRERGREGKRNGRGRVEVGDRQTDGRTDRQTVSQRV